MSFLSSWWSGTTSTTAPTQAADTTTSYNTFTASESTPVSPPTQSTASSIASYFASFSLGSGSNSSTSADTAPATTLSSFLSSESAMPHAYSNEFLSFIKSIGDIQNKRDEQEIILDLMSHLKDQINGTDIENAQLKEYIIQMIYCEMFGYSTEFGYLAAINLASCTDNFHAKRIGYLFVTNFIPVNHELSVMMVGTLQKDLQSTNYLVVDLALRGVSRMLTETSLPALEPQVRRLFSHHKALIRKKAVLALMQCYEIRRKELLQDEARQVRLRRRANSGAGQRASAVTDGASSEFAQRHRENDTSILSLCHDAMADADVQVMNAAIITLYELVQRQDFFLANRERLMEFVPSLVSILNQISENRLDKSYLYHRIPAPWIQVRVMKILAVLGRKNKEASLQMYEVLREVARRSDNGNQTGNSVLYEAVRCMSLIYPNKVILNYASEYAETMLSNATDTAGAQFSALDNQNSANLRYVGLQALCDLVQARPEFAAKFQQYIVASLESKDEALLRKALDLLFSMTNQNNSSVIVRRMISILRHTFDVHFAAELTRKIFHLSQKYAPNEQWFLEVADDVMKLRHAPVGREHIELVLNMIAGRAVVGDDGSSVGGSESDEDSDFRGRHNAADLVDATHLQIYSVDKYFEESLAKSEYQLPLVYLEVIIYVLGTYGHKSSKYSLEEVLLRLCDLAERRYDEESGMLQLIVYAMLKLVAKSADPAKHLNNPQLSDLLMRFRNSSNVDLQQRCYEFLRLKQIAPSYFAVVAPTAHVVEIDSELHFLDGYVESLGGEQYDEKILEVIVYDEQSKKKEQLKIDTTPSQRLRGYLPNQAATSGLDTSNVADGDSTSFSVNMSNVQDYDEELILKPIRSTWGDEDEEEVSENTEESEQKVEVQEQRPASPAPVSNTSSKSSGSEPTAQMKDLLARNFRADPLTDTFQYGEDEAESAPQEEMDPKKREKAKQKWGSLFVGLDVNEGTVEENRSAQRRGNNPARKAKRKQPSAVAPPVSRERSASNLWSDDFEEESSTRSGTTYTATSSSPSPKKSTTTTIPHTEQTLVDFAPLDAAPTPKRSTSTTLNQQPPVTEQPHSPLDDLLDFDSAPVPVTSDAPLIASPSQPRNNTPTSPDTFGVPAHPSAHIASSILTPKQANYNPNAYSQRLQREMAIYPPQPQIPEICAEDNEISVRYIKAWKPKSLEVVFFLRNKSQKLSHVQFMAQSPEGIFVALSGDPQLVHGIHGSSANVQFLKNPNHEVAIRATLTLRDASYESSFVGTIQYQTKANPGIFQSVMFDISLDLFDIMRPDTLTLTAQFAQLWPKLDFERQIKLQDVMIDSVLQYVDRMKRMQLHIVDVKGNEVIATARVLDLDEKCLVHVKVSGTTVQFTCKCDKKNIVDALILHAERSKKVVL